MKKYTKYILFCTKFIFIIVMYKKNRKYTEKFCINNYVHSVILKIFKFDINILYSFS